MRSKAERVCTPATCQQWRRGWLTLLVSLAEMAKFVHTFVGFQTLHSLDDLSRSQSVDPLIAGEILRGPGCSARDSGRELLRESVESDIDGVGMVERCGNNSLRFDRRHLEGKDT